MGERLGLVGSVSIALGGMIGGGIYAVLGVVTGIAGPATWLAFVVAGVVALCTGYAYVALNDLADGRGGSVTFVLSFTGNATLAGVVGWTLLFGYVGSMAMYAFAFAEFARALPGVPDGVAGLPLRPVVSVGAVAAFVGLNFLGARTTGVAESVLVAGKVLVLVAFGLAGVAYGVVGAPDPMQYGLDRAVTVDPLMAAGVSFVAFQGWQLLFYDQERIADAASTVRTAVPLAVVLSVAVYVLVAVATYNLAPEALQTNPHTALADAATRLTTAVGYGDVGGLLVALSALLSTGSAINATLFSSGHFAKGMLSEDLLPDRVGDATADGVPARTLVGLGVVTAALTAWGSLNAVTSFASVAFIAVFGSMSYLAFRHRDADAVHPLPPLVGAVGAGSFLPVMLYHLWSSERGTFVAVVVLAVLALGVELLYFERDAVEAAVTRYEPDAGDDGGRG